MVMSPVKYIQEAVGNCAVHLAFNYNDRFRLPQEAENPFKMGYDPELDTSPHLDPDAASCHLTIIGILRWMIKLKRIDIMTEVSLLSPCVALIRERYLDAEVFVIAHVGQRCNSRLVYNPLYPETYYIVF